MVLSPTSIFVFEGNGSATLRDVVARFDGPAAAYWLPPAEGGLCRQLGSGWRLTQEGRTRLPWVRKT